MKKNYFKTFLTFLIISLTMINLMKAQVLSFSVGAPGNDYTLTCINSPITMTAMGGTAPINYTWSITGSTITGNYANVSMLGIWTVVAQNTVTSATSQQTFAISTNYSSPTVAVNPATQNIICNVAGSCFTATCNQGPNITTNWFQQVGANRMYVGVSQGTINTFCPNAAGTYWFEAKNNLTGCSTTESVLVTSSALVPQFSVSSTTDFTVGCSTASITGLQVSSVITSPSLNQPCNYAFVVPPATATPVFTINPNFNNISVPGIYVAYVKDLTTNCVVSQSVTIIQNTVQSSVYAIQPLNILSCLEPTMSLTGVSSNSNAAVTWTVPGTPSNSVIPISNYSVSTSYAISGSSTNITSLGIYTVGAFDNYNYCRSTKTLQINQDLRKPVFAISALSNSVITCLNNNVLIVPIMNSTLAIALVPTYTWYPPPAGPGVPGTQYNTVVPGTHSAIAMASTNGCTYQAVYMVLSDLNVAASNATLATSCPVNTIIISPVYSSTIDLTCEWSGPTGAIISPTNQITITGNAPGDYFCIVTNTINGCSKTVTCSVVCDTGLESNDIDNPVQVFPNPSNGKISIEMNSIFSNSKICFYDLQGKLLKEMDLRNKTIVIDLNLPKGYYQYKITEEDKLIKTGKLIVQ